MIPKRAGASRRALPLDGLASLPIRASPGRRPEPKRGYMPGGCEMTYR